MLKDLLQRVPESRTALSDDEGDHSFSELTALGTGNYDGLTQARVAIIASDLWTTLKTLALSDGQAHSIALISPAFPDESIYHLLNQFRPNIIVSERSWQYDKATITEDITLLPQRNGMIRDPMETKWVLSTSGTTGRPKLVQHTLKSLYRTSNVRGENRSDDIWGLLYDQTRFAGLQVVLQSILSGARIVEPSTSWPLSRKLQFFNRHNVTHVSGTPSLWRKILMTEHHQFSALKQITLGGEIVDQEIINSLKKEYPSARITHIFASTEAGVGFSVNDEMSGFPVSHLTNSVLKNRIKIVDDYLYVRNDEVEKRYVDGSSLSEGEWINTGDLVKEIEGRIHFQGRASGLINVGGNKVLPELIEKTLVKIKDIAAARAYGKKNPILGNIVIADVVSKKQLTDEDKKKIIAFCERELEGYMVPRKITQVVALETNSAGKINRS